MINVFVNKKINDFALDGSVALFGKLWVSVKTASWLQRVLEMMPFGFTLACIIPELQAKIKWHLFFRTRCIYKVIWKGKLHVMCLKRIF